MKHKKAIIVSIIAVFMSCISVLAYAEDITISYTLKGDKSGAYYTSDVGMEYTTQAVYGLAYIEVRNGSTLIYDKAGMKGTEEPLSDEFEITKDVLKKCKKNADGEYEFLFKVTDTTSKTKSETIKFKADISDPEVNIAGVVNNSVVKEAPTITAGITDDNMEDLTASLELKKDGVIVETITDIEKINDYKKEIKENGKYEITITAKDCVGNQASEKRVFIYDTKAPVVSDIVIDGEKSDRNWYGSDVTIAGSFSDELSGIKDAELKINGEKMDVDFENNEYSFVFSKEMISNKTKFDISITVIDNAGNKAEKTASFNADITKPEIELSGIEDNSIVNETVTIKAKGKDNSGFVDVNLLVINSGGDTVYDKTSSNDVSYTFSADGKYTIYAYAKDYAGNRTETQEISFIRDTVRPSVDTLNISGIVNSGYNWFKSDATLEGLASDDFSGLNTVSIEINGNEIYSADADGAGSFTYKKGITKAWIEDNESSTGKYNVEVKVEDRAGNKNVKSDYFYADTVTPKISLSGIEEDEQTSKTPKITASVTDNYPSMNTIYMDVFKDGRKIVSRTKEGSELSTSAFEADGDYEVKAYSIDRAGNVSAQKTISFIKDTTAPVVELSGAKVDSFNKGTITLKAVVKERNYRTAKVTSSLKKTLDGKTSQEGFAVNLSGITTTTTKKLSSTGTYTAEIIAEDKAGNKSQKKTLIFTVDNTKPVIKITGIKDVAGYNSVIAPKITFKDSYFKDVSMSLKRNGGTAKNVSYKTSKTKTGGSITFSNFAKVRSNDGIYSLTCTVVDKAGNTEKISESFRIDRFGSVFKISNKTKKLKGTYNQSIDDSCIIFEDNVTKLQKNEVVIKKDGEAIQGSVKVSDVDTAAGYRYTYNIKPESFEQEGAYDINITSEDAAGNFSEFSNDGRSLKFFVDKTAPIITVSGIEDKGVYDSGADLMRLEITDNIAFDKFVIYCNDKEIYNSETGKEVTAYSIPNGINQTIRIDGVDKAGNVSSKVIENVTVSDSFFARFFANKTNKFIVAGIAIILLAGAAALIFKRRQDKKAE